MAILEICQRQLTYTPPPLASLEPDVSGALEALVQRTLSKDPAKRGSMEDLADDLAEELHRLDAPLRAAALNLPVPPRNVALAKTEPALAAVSDRPPTSGPSGGPAAPVAQRGGEPRGGEANRGTVLPPEAPSPRATPEGPGRDASPAPPGTSTRAAQPAALPAELPSTLRSVWATVPLSAQAPAPSPAHAAALSHAQAPSPAQAKGPSPVHAAAPSSAGAPAPAAPPARTVPMEAVVAYAPAERGSTAIPVARPTSASAAPQRRLGPVLGIGGGLLVVALGMLGWWVAGRDGPPAGGAMASATGTGTATAAVTATATARPGVTAAPGITASASAARARPGAPGASAAPRVGPVRRPR
jgi:hypothetical protein